ncbi:PAS domain S-box-containing protein [Rubricella aquisinus]|uniref:histidine kinase n=1 Tax=Rubricella aquisinus TaxID=2028108 RepID=A0A840X2J6_9RHOB|nr:PAS domain-containing hybrid sensor histidine kinase/response regulator [Rubricella aquisinus]MBB5517054.1 PAS domain S-box-containing protein [Rubricella aquisinus]
MNQKGLPLPAPSKFRTRIGRAFIVVAGLFALGAIAYLAVSVARDINQLGSAHSDNVQWTLSQTNVEFLEYKLRVEHPEPDITELRQKFDVFYSRMNTVRRASVFEGLRNTPEASARLVTIFTLLDASVPIIDSSDDELQRRLPALVALSDQLRPEVRALANSGLKVFALAADAQRSRVANTMTKLAAATTALVAVLAWAILQLNLLNRRIYRRERERNQTAKRMETVMGTSLDGVIVSDAEGRITQFNPAAEQIFGHRAGDVLGKDIGAVIVPDHMRDAHDAGMERIRRHGEKRVVGKGRVKLEAKRKDGTIFPVELAIQSATTHQGEIFIAFLRDITAQVAAEAELVSARDRALANEKLKTDFLSTMSHEIRTPLNGLLGNMSLLRDTALNPEQAKYLGHMETSGRLLMSHISDVLDITRYDAGKLNTRSEPVNISALVQDIVDNQTGAAFQHETSLEWRWRGPRYDWILSDHDRLQHVMMNIIGNAVKFTRRGHVAVRLEALEAAADPRLRIEIEDDGPGISDDMRIRIFDDFVTGNTSYDRDVGGTGLGLSIAKRFITALGGQIGVESDLGKGCTFWIELPLIEATPAPEEATAQTQPDMQRALNILLVEDNEINRIVAREMLQQEGHSVTEAYDGKQGADLAKLYRFDLILMDISMPVMDGRAATRRIRNEGGASASAPIIAVTANAMADEQAEFLKDGMDGILTKPVSREALKALLHSKADTDEDDLAYINAQHSQEARDTLGQDAFAKLTARFVSEVELLIDWLNDDKPKDLLEIASKAHAVAGSAGIFGAVQLRETLKQLENAAKTGDKSEIADLSKRVNIVWLKTKPLMQK